MVVQLISNQWVVGPSPTSGSKFLLDGISGGLDSRSDKAKVVGPSPTHPTNFMGAKANAAERVSPT